MSVSENSEMSEAYQECTEHVEADEVDDGKAAAAGSLLSGVVVRLGVTQFPRQAGQHNLLPRLACGTPDSKQETVLFPFIVWQPVNVLSGKQLKLQRAKTWKASEPLGEKFESYCCDWFGFRPPLLFSQTPKGADEKQR